MNIKTFLTVLTISLSFIIGPAYSQNNTNSKEDEKKQRDEVNKRFRRSLIDKLNQEKKLIEKLLGVDIYKQFDGQLEKLLEEFDDGFHDNMQKIFEDDTFNPFFQGANQFQYGFGSLGTWSETDQEKIFTIEQDFPKDTPLDIKIENRQIKVKGIIEKKFKRKGPHGDIAQVQKMTINKQVSIPHDVYWEKARFEQKDGKTRIAFPKKNAMKPTQDSKPENSPPNNLKPLKKRKGETTI